jgi:hypothetical protein
MARFQGHANGNLGALCGAASVTPVVFEFQHGIGEIFRSASELGLENLAQPPSHIESKALSKDVSCASFF